MIKQLFLATTNANKLEEFQNILGQKYDVKTLLDIKQFLGTENWRHWRNRSDIYWKCFN